MPVDDVDDNPWMTGDAPRGAAYDARFDELAASGRDVHGEARFVASLGASSVLDAGCGTGRVAIALARRGLDVVGVDLDPAMLGEARAKAPQCAWVHDDIARMDLGRRFEAVVLAGNVMLFVAAGTEGIVLANLARHVAMGGVLVAGFSLERGLGIDTYDAYASAAGLTLTERFATWDRDAFGSGSGYAVSVHYLAP